MLTGNAGAAAQSQGPTLSAHIEVFDAQISRLEDLHHRLCGIADKITGSSPRAVPQNGAEVQKVEPVSLLAKYDLRGTALARSITMLLEEALRIDRAL